MPKKKPVCMDCSAKLNKSNWYPSFKKQYKYLCISCQTQRNWQIKLTVLQHYGPDCACCGCDIPEFLTIDHILNNGAEHRRELSKKKGSKSAGNGGISFYRWLIKNNFPEGYAVNCFNCNCAKGIWGKCPHEKNKD